MHKTPSLLPVYARGRSFVSASLPDPGYGLYIGLARCGQTWDSGISGKASGITPDVIPDGVAAARRFLLAPVVHDHVISGTREPFIDLILV